ncbi:hypothetical protein BCR32DRAFT_296075 [Anaeromyces robustus]|uniref:Scaffoldin n=1 Tax=Anaeromyces robustus TaxID=1754192 RepID=A0A1Y1WTC6_9FUNG|nr:hypothetical protein BCR32DRAFT_296075 [Anaeromyces robustus]|eukprot:ORX76702.1 hypothetical protein BCR32DRAFT_296075 [Anaeromyces robustus]
MSFKKKRKYHNKNPYLEISFLQALSRSYSQSGSGILIENSFYSYFVFEKSISDFLRKCQDFIGRLELNPVYYNTSYTMGFNKQALLTSQTSNSNSNSNNNNNINLLISMDDITFYTLFLSSSNSRNNNNDGNNNNNNNESNNNNNNRQILFTNNIKVNNRIILGLFLVGNQLKSIAAPNDYTTCSSDSIIMKYSVNDGVIPCTRAIITGFVLYNGGVLECTGGTCSKVTVADKNYYINSGSSEPLIRCGTVTPDGGSSTVVCDTVETANGYFKNAKGNKLIKCEGEYCEVIASPANGYYINGDTNDTNKIIRCASSTCSIINSSTEDTEVVTACGTNKEGMLLTGDNPQYICTGSSGTYKSDFKVDKYGYYYITTGSSAASTPFGASTSVLLRMGKGSVTVVPTAQYGFFINNNSINKAAYPIIKNYHDSGAKTVMVAKVDTMIKSSCEKALSGGVIRTANGNTVKSFCPSSSGTAIDLEDITEEKYMVLNVQGGLPYDSTEGTTVLLKYGNAAVSIVPDPGTGYFLNSGPDATANPIIKSVSGDCKTENPIPGLYPNAGWNKSRIPYFGCNGRTCVGLDTLQIPTTCGEAGIGNIAQFGGHTYFCPTLDNKTKLDVVAGTGTQYFLLNISKNKSSYFLGENASTSDQKLLVKFERGGVITVVNEPTGYYLNFEDNGSTSDSDKNLYPVIKCWKGNCEKIPSNKINEITSGTTCTAEASGDIIYHTTNQDYEFCKDGTLIALTTPSNYYVTIAKNKYTAFTGPYVLEDETKKIFVYLSENAVELQNVDGYYINDEAVTITEGTTSKLIKCRGGQCRPESTAALTYYMNDGKEKTKPLIKCTTNGSDCEEDNGADNTYYINSGDGCTVIYCETTENCNTIVPGSGYYKISGETYKCENDKGCEKMTGGVICSSGEGGKLQTSAFTTICTGKANDEITFAADGVNKYKKEGEEKKILLKTTQTSIIYVGSPANGYYISGANALIKCNSKGCEDVNSPSLGYYLNAGEDAKEHPFFYCNENGSCTATADTNVDVVTACSSASDIGKLLYDDSNGITKFCINASNSSVSISTEVTEDGSQTFNLLTVTAPASGAVNNKFTKSVAASNTKKVVVKPGNNAIVKMISSKTTPNTVDFCYKTSDNTKLIRDKDGASDFELIDTTANEYYANGGKEGTVIYCKSGSNCSVLKAIKGYYIGGTDTSTDSVIGCDGSKCESVVVTTGVCSAKYGGNIGKAGSDIKLCYTDTNDQWYDISQGEKYYLVTVSNGHSSALIGTGTAPSEGKEILAKVGGKKALLVSTEGYYLNAGGTTKTDTLVEVKSCVGDVCTINSIDSSDKPAFYVDAADPGKYIKCDGINKCEEATVALTPCSNPCDMIKSQSGISICVKNGSDKFVPVPLSSEVESYYIINGVTTNPITGSPIAATVKVLVKVGKGVVLNIGSITNGERFLSSGLNQIITCTTDLQSCEGAVMAEGYYLLNKDTGGSKFIFKCDSNGCIEEVTPESGYYYPNKGDATNTVIEYKNGVFTEIVGSGPCGAGVNAGVLAKKNNKGYYFCSTADTSSSEIDFSEEGEKYYVIDNGEETAFGSTGTSLIKSGNGKAQLVETINNGYYISGNDKIIKCTGIVPAVNVLSTSTNKALNAVLGGAVFSVKNPNDVNVRFDTEGSITEVTGGTKGEGNTLTLTGDKSKRVYTVEVNDPTGDTPTATITAGRIEGASAIQTTSTSVTGASATNGIAIFTVNGKIVDVEYDIDGIIISVSGGTQTGDNTFTIDGDTISDRVYTFTVNDPTGDNPSARINAVIGAVSVSDPNPTRTSLSTAGNAIFNVNDVIITVIFDPKGRIIEVTGGAKVEGTENKFTINGDSYPGREYQVTITNPNDYNARADIYAPEIEEEAEVNKSSVLIDKAKVAVDGSAIFQVDSHSVTVKFDCDGRITIVESGGTKVDDKDNTLTITDDINSGREYTVTVTNPTEEGVTAEITAAAVTEGINCETVAIKPGYYLNGAETKDGVISCTATQCTAETIAKESCVDAGVGSVIKEDIYIGNIYRSTKFYYCPVNDDDEKVQFGEEADQYHHLILISSNLGTSGTQLLLKKEFYAFNIPIAGLSKGYYLDHREKGNMKLVKCTTTVCTTVNNPSNSEIKYYLNENPNEEIENLIKCNSNGCTVGSNIPGFYINGDSSKRIIKCTGTVACTEVNNDATDYYTSNTSCVEGKLLKGGTTFCTDDTKNVKLSDEGYYLINNPTNGPFTDSSTKVLVKSGDNAIITVTSPGTGYYLNGAKDASTKPIISCKNDVCQKVSSTSIKVTDCDDGTNADVGVLVSDSQGGIYVCKKAEAGQRGKIEAVNSVTYFPITLDTSDVIIGGTKYSILLKKSNNAIVLEEATTYVNLKTKKGSIDPTEEYDKCKVDGNIYRYTISSKKIDDITSKSCVEICPLESNSQCRPGYYLAQKGTKTLVVESDHGNEGDLYECTESDCTKLTEASTIPIGYLVNEGNTKEAGKNVPYILCMKDKNNVICKAEKITRTDCTSGTPHIGDIAKITDSKTQKESIKICLGLIGAESDTDNGVELNQENTVNYMVNIDKTNNIFGIDKVLTYMVININGGNAIVNKETVCNISPKYRYTDKTYKIYTKNSPAEEKEAIRNDGKTLYEFELSYDENKVAYYIYNGKKTWTAS